MWIGSGAPRGPRPSLGPDATRWAVEWWAVDKLNHVDSKGSDDSGFPHGRGEASWSNTLILYHRRATNRMNQPSFRLRLRLHFTGFVRCSARTSIPWALPPKDPSMVSIVHPTRNVTEIKESRGGGCNPNPGAL